MVPEDDANACDLPFEIGTVALTEVLPGLRNHPFLRDRLLISFALAQDNAFVIGPVRKKTPSWTAVFMLLKTIFLPRQARDRRGGGMILRKGTVFSQVSVPVPDVWGRSAVPMGRSVTLAQFVRGAKNASPFF
eukprot:COSAG06_NODE_4146_length_4526_cov_3.098487_6_plen_133_part_00